MSVRKAQYEIDTKNQLTNTIIKSKFSFKTLEVKNNKCVIDNNYFENVYIDFDPNITDVVFTNCTFRNTIMIDGRYGLFARLILKIKRLLS